MVAAMVLAGVAPSAAEPARRVEEVVFTSGDVELAGRLWLPEGRGPHAALVFIPGSGRSIRDLELDPDPVPFHFVDAGVAFLAWDKRGVRDSGGEFAPLSDEDPVAQLERLRLLASDAAALSSASGTSELLTSGTSSMVAIEATLSTSRSSSRRRTRTTSRTRSSRAASTPRSRR